MKAKHKFWEYDGPPGQWWDYVNTVGLRYVMPARLRAVSSVYVRLYVGECHLFYCRTGNFSFV